MNYKLGKTAARNMMRLKFADFITPSKLPPLPASDYGYGHDGLIGKHGWLGLGNDVHSNCVYAGGAHEHMLASRVGGNPVNFRTPGVLADYGAVTGFDPKKPETDQGGDMLDAAKYRKDVGLIDAQGNRHKVDAYLALEPGNPEHIWYAIYLFVAVGIGLQLPDSAMAAAENDQMWDVVAGAKIEGGHYVPGVARRHKTTRIVSWGAEYEVSDAFMSKYCDEAVAYVFPESLVNQKSPEGFDYSSLMAALGSLG